MKDLKTGKWDIPAGKPKDEKEASYETAIRETFEEAGLEVKPQKLLATFEGDLYLYHCTLTSSLPDQLRPMPGFEAEIAQVALVHINFLNETNVRFPSVLSQVKELFATLPEK